jgi:hypothetical protein
MLTYRFEQLIKGLLKAFIRYDDTPRNPANVVDLAAARSELDAKRREIAAERDNVMSVGPSMDRDEFHDAEETIARSELFVIAHTSN